MKYGGLCLKGANSNYREARRTFLLIGEIGFCSGPGKVPGRCYGEPVWLCCRYLSLVQRGLSRGIRRAPRVGAARPAVMHKAYSVCRSLSVLDSFCMYARQLGRAGHIECLSRGAYAPLDHPFVTRQLEDAAIGLGIARSADSVWRPRGRGRPGIRSSQTLCILYRRSTVPEVLRQI